MSYKMNGLIAAMEEIDNEPVAVDGDEAVELVETVADDSATVQADADEVGVSVSQVEDAVQAGGELEDIADVASEAVKSGEGLDESAAEMASISIESIRNRLGIRGESRLVPATESFGNVNTRVMSTRLIVENIGDTLKRIWAAIKAAAARIWEKIKSFLAGLFNSTSGLIKLINGLRDRTRKLPTDAKLKEKKIKQASVAKAISVKGKANMASFDEVSGKTLHLVGISEEFGKLGRSIVAAAEKLAESEINEANVAAYLKGGENAASEAERVLKAAFGGAEETMGGTGPAKGKGKKKAGKLYGPFVGNTMLNLEISDIEGGGTRFTAVFVAAKEKAAEEVEALEPAQIAKVLDQSLKLASVLQDYRKTEKDVAEITKKTQGLADVIIKTTEKVLNKTGSSTQTRLALSEMKNDVNSALQMINSFGSRAPALTFQLAKAGADYASVSLRNIGEKAFGGK